MLSFVGGRESKPRTIGDPDVNPYLPKRDHCVSWGSQSNLTIIILARVHGYSGVNLTSERVKSIHYQAVCTVVVGPVMLDGRGWS